MKYFNKLEYMYFYIHPATHISFHLCIIFLKTLCSIKYKTFMVQGHLSVSHHFASIFYSNSSLSVHICTFSSETFGVNFTQAFLGMVHGWFPLNVIYDSTPFKMLFLKIEISLNSHNFNILNWKLTATAWYWIV